MDELVLRSGRDRSVRRRHPWVLSGAVERGGEKAAPGDLVCVRSATGEVVGYGLYSPSSAIRVRLVRFGKEEPPGDWLERGIAAAVGRRSEDPLLRGTNAVRLVNSEGDALPGLVVDRYPGVAVVKLTTAGMARRREAIAAALGSAAGVATVLEREDGSAARREGFRPSSGALVGEAPPAPVEVEEHGRHYQVDVVSGQKTGFYLDQRDSRSLVERMAAGRRVLDLFAYTGGFAAAAARGGAASVTLVESSAGALELARGHVERNSPAGAPCAAHYQQADAFRFLRASDDCFDLIIVDPPPLARRRSDVARATRAYKDLLLHALRRSAPGALVLSFSCSHHVGTELFRKVAFGASLDAGRALQVLGILGSPSDHPIALDHPEGDYLNGLLLRA